MLHTELIIPDHFHVANAVGAVAGCVMVQEEAWIIPQTCGMHIVGYYVQSGAQRKQFSKLTPALECAQKLTGEKAVARANASGVIDPQLTFQQLPDGADSYRLRAIAVGNPRIMKGN
jgi:hypothetical protein